MKNQSNHGIDSAVLAKFLGIGLRQFFCVLLVLSTWLLSGCQTTPLPTPIQPSQGLAQIAQTGPSTPEVNAGQVVTDQQFQADDATAFEAYTKTSIATQVATSRIAPELLAAPDLWGRMRQGFAVPPLENDLVNKHAKRFASNGRLQLGRGACE
ncbi:hypothetical protein [Rhodoferax sp.]|uniref:hypothetical protein n=1 Tax=Rhodoferax sp. TaxID=50421 RepID=UPI0027249868|nr:hypothetical protein [Rhodoferax sp.]MDO8320754.1 hypothetical protein [Rhodoferax sp.]